MAPKAPPKIILSPTPPTQPDAQAFASSQDKVELRAATSETNTTNMETSITVDETGITIQKGNKISGMISPARPSQTPNFNKTVEPDEVISGIGVNDTEDIKYLGKGNFGTVFMVRHKTTHETMARKELSVPGGASSDDEMARSNLLRELHLLFRCQHPNIVAFRGAFFTNNKLNICMELMDAGSMNSIIKKAGRVPEFFLAKIALFNCVALHEMKVKYNAIHRDIKPDNMLVNTKGEVKLCDFGISNFMSGSVVFTRCGTQNYLSPERVDSEKVNVGYGTKADVWSLGISLMEMALGRHPLKGADKEGWGVLNAILTDPIPTLPEDEPFSDEFRSFLKYCLIRDEAERWDPAQLLTHPFLVRQQGDTLDSVAEWVRSVVGNPAPEVLNGTPLAEYRSNLVIDISQYQNDHPEEDETEGSADPGSASVSSSTTTTSSETGEPTTEAGSSAPTSSTTTTAAAAATDHVYKVHTVYSPTFCEVCNEFLWGLARQGWQCQKCKMITHRKCREISGECPGHPPEKPAKVARGPKEKQVAMMSQ